ncbi:response regulator transcription factor [Methylobacterium trifolii]|uniref:Regulator of RpoS n=1 Tax=Methylobacterium trifolii TaxID=1003092 RepID=A0ABQ4TVV7_9HYPH|nr:response regulator transcription factor [Methylobacterium trifolii]GJE59365.1 Regulator of RpoS [Methylobacterium trifolii]
MRRRILCVEDDEAIAELVHEVLTEAGFAVDLAASGPEGLAKAGDRPDAVICDIDLPGLGGLDLLRSVREAGAQVPFIVLTAFGERGNQIEARRLGCDDFVTKPVDFELLLAVLHNVLQRSPHAARPEAAGVRLTEREREIVTWVARGKSSADIAAIVGISERTVNFHVDRVMRKLAVSTRMQAAIACIRLGLIAA